MTVLLVSLEAEGLEVGALLNEIVSQLQVHDWLGRDFKLLLFEAEPQLLQPLVRFLILKKQCLGGVTLSGFLLPLLPLSNSLHGLALPRMLVHLLEGNALKAVHTQHIHHLRRPRQLDERAQTFVLHLAQGVKAFTELYHLPFLLGALVEYVVLGGDLA